MNSPTYKTADKLAILLDKRFSIPGTQIKFGLDGILGVIPVVGDTITSLISGYIILLASRSGVSRATLVRMTFNAGIDYLIGLLPIVGDFSDVFWKANSKNIDLWKKATATKTHQKQKIKDKLFTTAIVIIFVFLAVLPIIGIIEIFKAL